MRGRFAEILSVVALTLVVGAGARADIIQSGGTYNVSGTNFPTNFSQTVTVSSTPTLINSGQLTLAAIITPDGPNAEWVEFVFTRVGGGPLAGNINAGWGFNINNVPLTTTAEWDQTFLYFGVNGTAVSPIFPFLGFTTVAPNPINPALGPAYIQLHPGRMISSLDTFAFANPYSAITAGGMNPNLVNEVHIAAHLKLQEPVNAVPEPSTALLAMVGLAGGVVGKRLQRRRLSAAAVKNS